MKSNVFILLFVALAAATIGANGDGENETSAIEGAEELVVWWNNIDGPDMLAHTQEFLDNNQDINLAIYPSEDLKTQTRLAVDSGASPDVFTTNAGSIFQDFVRAGALMDLTDIIIENNFLDRINVDYIKPYTIDGRYYGFPTSPLTTWQNLYVNMDLLNQAGITEMPETVDDLISVSKKLIAKGINPVAFGDKDGWPAIILLGDYFAQQVTNYDQINKLNSGQIDFSESLEFKRAFETIVELGQNDVFMPGWKSVDHTAAIHTFAAGHTAFLYNGSWWSALVDDVSNLGFEVNVIWLPLIDGISKTSSIQASSDMAFVASADSTNIEGIIKMLDFFTSEKTSITNAEANNAFSVYPGANSKIERFEVFNKQPILGQFEKPALSPFFDWVFPTSVTELLKIKIIECIEEKTTIDQALTDLQIELDKHLNTMAPL